jgi:hypothetical protein
MLQNAPLGNKKVKECYENHHLFYFFITQRSILKHTYTMYFIDYILLLFLTTSFLYAVLPLGEASFAEKLVYFKNILMPGVMYFLGRNLKLGAREVRTVFHFMIWVLVAAFSINVIELITQTHLHAWIDYGGFLDKVMEAEPSGNYGLTWTFETSSGRPRYGAFFANPLELASACIVTFPIGYYLLLSASNRKAKEVYLVIVIAIILSLYFSFSRASMAALFGEFIFIALVLKYYRFLFATAAAGVSIVIYIWLLANDDLRYFIIDTITFRNPSSFGHLVEWFQGFESVVASPMGIGLAMSGNASSVDESVRVGGENQFIIYAVQLGIPGLLMYITLLTSAIYLSIQAFFRSIHQHEKAISFVTASAKFGLLLPLMTANAELYLYVSYITWWLVGQSVLIHSKYQQQNRYAIQETGIG